jgi:hypothetical protein
VKEERIYRVYTIKEGGDGFISLRNMERENTGAKAKSWLVMRVPG